MVMDPSFESRKQMLSQVMPGYKGTREQNMELMEKIKSGDLDLSKLKKSGSKPVSGGNKPAPVKKTETPAPAPKPTPAPARDPKNYISPEESLALYKKNQSKMSTGSITPLYPEKYAVPGRYLKAAMALYKMLPEEQFFNSSTGQRLALPSGERLALPSGQRLALPSGQRAALPSAERLALNVPRNGAQMEIPFPVTPGTNSFGSSPMGPGFQSRIPFPKGKPGNPGVQTEIQFGVPRVGEQMTIPFRQNGGMNYFAGGEIENDPHIMELYGFENGGETMQLPVMPYGFAEMGMMAGDDVTGKTTPPAGAPKMMNSQQLAGLATQFFSRDPSMQTPIPNFVGNYQLSDYG